ncbi:UDP-N-acetylmuramate--L-alanine ligase [Phycisphaerales bacterium AB-hyl4]|uniref:UDP-N-acetylmuramate--L-alanine ligase n=1 Tax=Natronomicrosphaera hydrolytica TaxID=3242702 RepID=A0ABV4U8F8_9BACT
MMTAPSAPKDNGSTVDHLTADLTGRRVHFVGIGGCGMSGLARMAKQHGAVCTGSDLAASDITNALLADGIDVALQQTADTLPADCELIVASAAIKPEHPELAEARRRNIPMLKYAKMLGELMRQRCGVAIAGTHGKSTTTSILSYILLQADLDPSFIVGANCAQLGGGARTGKAGDDGVLIAEACEYDRSFHNFNPRHAVILNVEADHLDMYSSLDEIVEAFAVFARKVPSASDGGSLLINHEMSERLTITAGLDCKIETLGFAYQADWRVGIKAGNVRLHHKDKIIADWHNPLPGEHMAYNAAAAAITAHRLGAPWPAITAAIESFQGLDRRMQVIGSKADVRIIDDYGHHPTEVDTTLRALRQHYQPNRLICVFQPHQHSRTRFLMQQFAASFSEADIVIVPDIYFVRDSDQERHAVTAADLVDRLRKQNVQAMHLYPFDAIVEQLDITARPGDLVVTMGAGDVWKVAHDFLAAPTPS